MIADLVACSDVCTRTRSLAVKGDLRDGWFVPGRRVIECPLCVRDSARMSMTCFAFNGIPIALASMRVARRTPDSERLRVAHEVRRESVVGETAAPA